MHDPRLALLLEKLRIVLHETYPDQLILTDEDILTFIHRLNASDILIGLQLDTDDPLYNMQDTDFEVKERLN